MDIPGWLRRSMIDCFYFVDWVGIGCLRFHDDMSYVYRYQRLHFFNSRL